MSSRSVPRVVTRFREAFTPTPPSKAVIDRLLRAPDNTQACFYTVDHRSVPVSEARGREMQIAARDAESRLARERRTTKRALGHNALTLSREARVVPGDTLVFYFDVAEHQQVFFGRMLGALNEIEWQSDSVTGLYLQVARASLTRSVSEQKEAIAALRSQLAAGRMQLDIDSAHIVQRDMTVRQSTIDTPRVA